MCCWTHPYRDEQAQRNGETLDLVARDDPFRCMCKFSGMCSRRATEEDQLCDWCRGTNHQRFCDAFVDASSPRADPRVIVDEGLYFRYPSGWRQGVVR